MADKRAEPAPPRKLGNLAMIWRHAVRYPGRIAIAATALLVAASATLAIPDGFRRVIDKGFAASGGDVSQHFYYLPGIVVVMALATAVRFYFASWLGQRVGADLRTEVHRNLLRLKPSFFEEKRHSPHATPPPADTLVPA